MNCETSQFIADEERASNLVIWGAAALVVLVFVGALLAMAILR